MVLIKLALIVIITAAMFLSVWKTAVGLIIPPLCLWGYGWLTGFTDISLVALLVVSLIHVLVTTISWWLSGRSREASLAMTGAAVTGMGTSLLASTFFGAFLGFFLWLGFIGRFVTMPIAIGPKTVARSFIGGFLKVAYGTVMSGVIAYIIF